MRESRSSGSVEGVMSDHDSYSDFVLKSGQLLADLLYRDKLLNSFARGHLTRVDVSLRVRSSNVQAVELAGQMSGMADPTRNCAVSAVEDPHDAVHHIGNIEILLLRTRREIYGARGIVAAIISHRKFLGICPAL